MVGRGGEKDAKHTANLKNAAQSSEIGGSPIFERGAKRTASRAIQKHVCLQTMQVTEHRIWKPIPGQISQTSRLLSSLFAGKCNPPLNSLLLMQ